MLHISYTFFRTLNVVIFRINQGIDMGVFSFIGDIFKPAADLISDLTTTDEEKLILKNKLVQIENEMSAKLLAYEGQVLKSKSEIITAEANGQSWIQRNWRPVTMLTFVGLVSAHWLGLTPDTLSEVEVLEMMGLVKIGLGGYVVGRSAEKIVPQIAKVLKK
jgi:hypothetical protein